MSAKVEIIMKGQDGYMYKGYAKRHFLITKFSLPLALKISSRQCMSTMLIRILEVTCSTATAPHLAAAIGTHHEQPCCKIIDFGFNLTTNKTNPHEDHNTDLKHRALE